jgi:hypothetical protein
MKKKAKLEKISKKTVANDIIYIFDICILINNNIIFKNYFIDLFYNYQ